MFSGVSNSKDEIKNRMLRHALNYWDIKSPDDLDPIVKLILEALSTELYNLGNDIKNTEVRLLEKIANLLAPESLTCPNAAHAILHATPNELQEILPETTHFYSQKKISSKQDETLDMSIDIYFTPVDKVRLFNAAISYLATGNNLFVYNQQFNKQLIAQTIPGTRADNNSIWLGLEIDDRINDVNNLYFYFDWKNTEYELAKFNYQLLPLSKWYVNNSEVHTNEGLYYESKAGDDHPAKDLAVDYDPIALMEKDIKNYYDRKFITISGKGLNDISGLKEFYPAEFKNIFNEPDLQKLNKKLLWVKVVFPAALQQGALEEVYVYNNAFPVMNRRLNDDMKHRLKGGSNIIPLKTAGLEQFLSVRSLSDQSHKYSSNPFRKVEEDETGTYTIRHGGVERFDGRNAKEFITYLLELLRSESAAFSAYGSDFFASTLREMDQRIALMEQKTRTVANTAAEIPHYIIVKPYEGNEQMYVEYWLTLAETANAIRSGTRLQEYNGVKAKADSLFLLTTSVGGKDRLKPEERVNAFRYGLMTRNRIVTKEDIRNLCFHEMGSRISKVSVEKGFEMSAHPQQGFFRTIDISLTASQNERLSSEGWQVLFDQLHSKLQSRSGISNHYRIFLNK